ncbi:MAG: undecaprenyl/decaprenyl-phosphate alpha-N-acetylglucosaminyl 1-phosphate transferase [Prevotella sp.]|nr:undecaprenyl/decaprenyl-phosphate alpha-N-acetylglucosaminyl 1-phosphate transferase [Prevotella sp.]
MTNITLIILAAFLFSALCGLIFIPLIIRFCRMRGLYDKPSPRKIHSHAVPRLGGISFLPTMLMALMVAMAVIHRTSEDGQLTLSLWSVYFFISLTIVYCIGLVDDLFCVGALTKFFFQIVAAVIIPMSGLYINNMYGFCGIHEVPLIVGGPFTVFLLVFAMNAINLIDGIDGLAGGLSFIALAGFQICFYREELWPYCILIAGLMGVVVAFLFFNVFGSAEHGNKIFMGDSGSLTLGFILGFLLVKFSMHNPNVMPFRHDSLQLSYTLLIVPVFDVVRVSLLRLFHHRPIFDADKNHFHHKLMRAGLSQHMALIVILSLSLGYIVLNVVLSRWLFMSHIVVIDIILWLIIHMIINHAIILNKQPVFLIKKANKG